MFDRQHNKVGQYWTPEQAEALIRRWNKGENRPKVALTQDHRHLLETAHLVNENTSHVQIDVGDKRVPLCPFLYVCEMLRDQETGAAYLSGIYKGRPEVDPRWVETAVPDVLRELDIPLSYTVNEVSDGRIHVVDRA